jgi:predicted phosphate transport protein (TIGR00153 family)
MTAFFGSLRARWRKLFKRHPNRFISRMVEQAAIVVEGTDALQIYMQKPNKKNAARVRELEQKADEVRRILIDELNRTFVTPIDREDLFSLSRAIDDILDYVYSTTSEMDILNVAPNESLRAMAELLHNASVEIHLAIQRLEDHPGVAGNHAMSVKALENTMDTLYAEALATLFDSPKNLKDIVNMLKLREIYRHMYHAVGSAELAANVVSDIVIKFY